MATNQYNSKVVLSDGTVLMDLTSDTVDASHLLYGYTAHGRDGAPITGECTYDSDTTDATAAVGEILATKTAYVNKVKLTGTMPNNGGNNVTVTGTSGTTIPAGYYDGSGKALIDSTSATNLIADNIREGVTILGVEGTMSGSEDMHAQAKTVTSFIGSQAVVVTPDSGSGYNCLSQVTVNPIPITYTDNSAGGVTVTIGSAA